MEVMEAEIRSQPLDHAATDLKESDPGRDVVEETRGLGRAEDVMKEHGSTAGETHMDASPEQRLDGLRKRKRELDNSVELLLQESLARVEDMLNAAIATIQEQVAAARDDFDAVDASIVRTLKARKRVERKLHMLAAILLDRDSDDEEEGLAREQSDEVGREQDWGKEAAITSTCHSIDEAIDEHNSKDSEDDGADDDNQDGAFLSEEN